MNCGFVLGLVVSGALVVWNPASAGSADPTWQLGGQTCELSSATGFDVPVGAIPDFGAFTVIARLKFNKADEHTKFRLFDQTSGETGWSLDLQKSSRVGNFMILGFKGATFVAGDFYARDGETHEVAVTARKGLIVAYLDGKVVGRFFAEISPASRPLRVGAPLKDGPPEMKGIELLDLKVFGPDLEYYAKDEPRGAAAGYRCGPGWRIRVPDNADAKKLPALLYYGDSISHGYTIPLTKRLGSRMRLYHWSAFLYNPGVNKAAFAEALKTEKFDFVVFNNGLHSLHEAWQKASDDRIRQVYRDLVAAFREGAPKAKLIYLETTPHTAKKDASGKVNGFGDLDFMVRRLNRLADEVMEAEGVTVIPAYSLLADRLDLASGDGCHWQMPAYGLLVKALLRELGVAPVEIRVSPDGAYRSMKDARNRIRELRKAGEVLDEERVVVTLAPGVYETRETLELGAGDGHVAYRAKKPGTVFVSGAVRLRAADFRSISDPAELRRFPSAARGKVRVADLSAVLPEKVRTWDDACKVPPGPWLYANGGILPIARWPNEDARGGWTNFTQAVDRGLAEPDSPDPARRVKRPGSFVFDAPRVADWDFSEGVWLYGYWTHDWYEQILRAKAWTATPTNRVMELAGVHPYGIIGNRTWGASHRRFFALNVPAELDSPGEWWLDRAAKRLYAWPTAGWKTADIRLAVLDRPFVSAAGAKEVRFVNLDFEYGHETGAAIVVRDCEDVAFDGCGFRNLGGQGIGIEGGRRCRVRRCEICNLGATAVRIEGGDRRTLTRGDHVVADCTIHHYARFWRTYNPGVSVNGVGQTVRGCRISDAPHNGILYGGNDHLLEGNEICRVVQETSDAGAIYAGRDPTSLGNVIRGNYIHDLGKDPQFLGSKWGGFIHGVYLDDCDWGETVCSNLFARCGGCAMFLCGGNLHDVYGNVVVDCANGTGIDSRGLTWQKTSPMFRKPEGHRSWWHMKFEQGGFDWTKAPWNRYPRLAEALDGEPELPKICPVTNNWFVACGRNHHFDKETPAITNVLPICGNHYYADAAAALASGDAWLADRVRRAQRDRPLSDARAAR